MQPYKCFTHIHLPLNDTIIIFNISTEHFTHIVTIIHRDYQPNPLRVLMSRDPNQNNTDNKNK